jgi:Uncharacterized protein conserved in bacteria (DUF2059)
MRTWSSAWFAAVLTALALIAPLAQDEEEAGPADGIGRAKRELILRYIDATNVLGYYDQVVRDVVDKYRQHFPQVEAVFWTEFMAYHSEPTDLYRRLTPLYAKYFSESDLREVLVFLESPAGRKYTAVLPQIGRDTGAVARGFEESLHKNIFQQLRNSGY